MRTRNATTPKTPASQKKTPPVKKTAAAKTTPPPETSTPVTEPQLTPASEPAAEQSPATKTPTTTTKKVKRIVKRKVVRPKTPASAKAGTAPEAKADEAEEVKDEEGPKDEGTAGEKDVDLRKAEEVAVKDTEPEKQEEASTQKAEDSGNSQDKGKAKMDVDELSKAESPAAEGVSISRANEQPSEPEETKDEEKVEDVKEEANDAVEEELQDKTENIDDEQKPESMDDDQKPESMDDDKKPENMDDIQKPENMDDDQKPENMDDDPTEVVEDEADPTEEDDAPPPEGIEYGDEEGFVEPEDEDLQEDDEPEAYDEMKTSNVENKELAAAAKERKIKKELEIFVGGLDHEVVEDDVRKAFEKVGEVVEVRLLKDPVTNKNRGFAFVRFATKEQAKRALSEMKNPVIRGHQCGTAPNEDNDTLFLGNICNTWTKEAIKHKLKDFNVQGVENITLVQDPRHEGLSRGFCFIQFACHKDALNAFRRLQKPDAVFGHTERTAKVAFAEPLQEPDPDVMAKVKSVFIDGLPPFWDEDRVRKHFKVYGDIERITLARNMSTASRKDFGFVDYTTHESAIACIDDVNKKELVEGNSKTKVKARLSNPLPKTQAVKGGMCGGFRIGRPTGRSIGRSSGPSVNRPNFQYGRGSRAPFNDPVGPYGRRGPFRGGHGPSGPSAAPSRPYFGGPRYGVVDRGAARPVPPRREPFPIDDGGYTRPFMGRHYDDSYSYDDSHGLKRPYYMTEQDPAYMEPSRVRPRFDYSGSGRGTHFRDTYGATYGASYGAGGATYGAGGATYGAGSSMYSSGYYGPDYGARPHSSFNSRDRPYGSGSGYYY